MYVSDNGWWRSVSKQLQYWTDTPQSEAAAAAAAEAAGAVLGLNFLEGRNTLNHLSFDPSILHQKKVDQLKKKSDWREIDIQDH